MTHPDQVIACFDMLPQPDRTAAYEMTLRNLLNEAAFRNVNLETVEGFALTAVKAFRKAQMP